MWRRVSCEQLLHKSQSILSPRRNPKRMVAVIVNMCRIRRTVVVILRLRRSALLCRHRLGERESGSYSGTRQRNRSNSGPHQRTRRGDPK